MFCPRIYGTSGTLFYSDIEWIETRLELVRSWAKINTYINFIKINYLDTGESITTRRECIRPFGAKVCKVGHFVPRFEGFVSRIFSIVYVERSQP